MTIKISTFMKTACIFAICSLFFSSFGHSQTTMFGGRGLLRTQSAEVINPGRLYVNTFFSTFMKKHEQTDVTLVKDNGLTFAFTFGISEFSELFVNLKPYQDDQKTLWGQPGDSQIGVKLKLPFSGRRVYSAVRLLANLPTGQDINIPYEPYTSNEFGMATSAIVTADFTDNFPVFPLKAHLNFGYFDHNLKDRFFNDIQDQFLIAAGIKVMVRTAVIYSEYSAEVFANNPIVRNYSYNSQRLTQGVKFIGPMNAIYDVALDISLSENPEMPVFPYLKEYANWKVLVGVNYPLMLSKKTQNQRILPERKRMQIRNSQNQNLDEVKMERQNLAEELRKMEEALDKKQDQEKEEDPNGF